MDGQAVVDEFLVAGTAAVDEGMSCRVAATRFGVATATVIRWHDQRRSTGSYGARPQGGDTRSRRIEAHRETVLALHEARRDITPDELRRELGQAGVTVAISTLRGWCSSTRSGRRPT